MTETSAQYANYHEQSIRRDKDANKSVSSRSGRGSLSGRKCFTNPFYLLQPHYYLKGKSTEGDGTSCDMGRCSKKGCIAYPMTQGLLRKCAEQ